MKNENLELIDKLKKIKLENLNIKEDNKYIYFDCPYCKGSRSSFNKENERFSCFKCKRNEGEGQFFRNNGLKRKTTLSFGPKKYNLEEVLIKIFDFQKLFLREAKSVSSDFENYVKPKGKIGIEVGYSSDDKYITAEAMISVYKFSKSELLKTGLFEEDESGLACLLSGYMTTPLFENGKMITIIGLNYNNKFNQNTKVLKNLHGFENNKEQFRQRQDILRIWEK